MSFWNKLFGIHKSEKIKEIKQNTQSEDHVPITPAIISDQTTSSDCGCSSDGGASCDCGGGDCGGI